MKSIYVHNYFERKAQNYLVYSKRGLWKYWRQRETQCLKLVLGDIEGLKILELGCGSGYHSQQLSEWGCSDLTCVDISRTMLEQFDLKNCKKKV